MRVEVVDGIPFRFRRRLPRGFPVLERGLPLVTDDFVAAQRGADDLPVPQVARLLAGEGFELGNETHALFSTTDGHGLLH